jgi:hypothetical protein
MTQDEIIEMANQSELCQCIWIDDEGPEIASLVAFAKLVAEHEREACALIGDGYHDEEANCGDLIRARGTNE